MKTAAIFALTILSAFLLGVTFWQRHQLVDLKALLALSREASLELDRTAKTARETDARKISGLIEDRADLMRLRGEVNRLRSDLNSATKTAETKSARLNSKTEDHQLKGPFQKFDSNVRLSLRRGETVMAGGWLSAQGKRVLVFVSPGIEGQSQITVRSRFVELADHIVQASGLSPVLGGVDGSQSSLKEVLDENQTQTLFESFEKAGGADVLSAPVVTTLSGRQAQVQVVEENLIDGQKVMAGPTLDVTPTISPDGTVELVMRTQITIPDK